MRIELLHIDECPNTAETQERLEAALRILGRSDLLVHMRQLSSASETTDTEFAGSPTITVDGNDIFPTGAVANDLACRVYATPNGLAGLPTLNQVTEALKTHGL
ncbi:MULTISPECIES: hypothetical protein [Micrococcaceae]|uniref:hypothetical protein n=1 Tax=Micrococcaceae TaxID=1268 RepID=UPI0006D23994|nr:MULTISPECIES: hypothetical protein [Micrococcaceae]MCD4850740.1 thioredoxin family protein [Arthrobacter sp. AK01]MCP1415679.1 hypothetical protein [Paenarthrobacter sp. A20]